eukprot:4596231-Amphidinium_carterae.1
MANRNRECYVRNGQQCEPPLCLLRVYCVVIDATSWVKRMGADNLCCGRRRAHSVIVESGQHVTRSIIMYPANTQ